MERRTMADAVRAVLVKRAFVPGDPSAGGAMPPPGAMPPDAAAAGGGMPPDAAAAGGGMPPDAAAAAGGGMPPDPMAAIPAGGDMATAGAPNTGMINMTADEFTKFIKQMMQAFGQGGAAQQAAPQADIGAKLDTLIAVLQNKGTTPAAPAVAGA